MNINNFYQELDFRGIEIGVLLEDCLPENLGKIFINVLFPNTLINKPVNSKINKESTSNILTKNDSKINIISFESSNYIEMKIPKHISYFLVNEKGYIPSGTEFLICFVGGDLDKPRVIGVNE